MQGIVDLLLVGGCIAGAAAYLVYRQTRKKKGCGCGCEGGCSDGKVNHKSPDLQRMDDCGCQGGGGCGCK